MKFNTEDLISELYENIDEVDELLRNVEDLEVDVDDMTDEEKVNNLLRIAYVSYGNLSGERLRHQLISNPLELLFGLGGSKEPYFQKHINKVTKYSENPIGFYKNIEKTLQNTGRKVIKKMAKVYSLLPD